MSKAKPAKRAARALVDLPTVGARCGEVFEADAELVDALCATGAADASAEATAAGPAASAGDPGDTPPEGPVPAPPPGAPQKATAPAAKG